jgi:hypothetical protein
VPPTFAAALRARCRAAESSFVPLPTAPKDLTLKSFPDVLGSGKGDDDDTDGDWLGSGDAAPPPQAARPSDAVANAHSTASVRARVLTVAPF